MVETVFNPNTDDLDPPEIGSEDKSLKTKKEKKKEEEEEIIFQASGGAFDPQKGAPKARRRRPKMGK